MIKFEDMSYEQKRSYMREKVYNDSDMQEIIDYVVYHSHECTMPIKTSLDKEHILRKLLVDGYIAFEKIYDKTQSHIIDYSELDPIHLQLQSNSDWVQYPDIPSLRRLLFDTQILYLSYNDWVKNGHTSLVEQIIVSGLSMDNIALINIIADESYRILLNFDKKLERRAKLERILDGC